jgi:hypothetical protein
MIVDPTNKSVTELKGLHLYHADMSNCSMRPERSKTYSSSIQIIRTFLQLVKHPSRLKVLDLPRRARCKPPEDAVSP